MKKFILMAGLALILAGCNKGGTEDSYDAGKGAGKSSRTNAPNQNEPSKKNMDPDKL